MIYFCRLKEKKLHDYSCEYSCFTCLHIRFHSNQTRIDMKSSKVQNSKTFQLDSQVCLNLIVVHNIFQPVDSVKGCGHLATQEQRSRISYW